MDKVLEYKENISKRLERYEKIVDLEKQTGVDKFYIFVAISVLSGILLFVVGGAQLIVSLVGFIYPAYQSFKAISTPNAEDDTQWLTYWVVYAFFNITESITDLILSWYVPSSSSCSCIVESVSLCLQWLSSERAAAATALGVTCISAQEDSLTD